MNRDMCLPMDYWFVKSLPFSRVLDVSPGLYISPTTSPFEKVRSFVCSSVCSFVSPSVRPSVRTVRPSTFLHREQSDCHEAVPIGGGAGPEVELGCSKGILMES